MFGISIPSVYIAIAGAAIFGLAVWKSYDVGYSYAATDGNLKITQIKLDIQKEYSDQLQKMADAAKVAQDQQKVLSGQLDNANAALDSQIKINEDLAAKDPTATSCGIGSGSTDRLNQIQ